MQIALQLQKRKSSQSTFEHGGGGACESPSLTGELLTVDGWERRNNTLSLGMWILVGWPCSCECFHTHAYMGKKKNQICYFKKGYGRGQYECDGFRGRIGEWLWSKYIIVYMHEILKNNKIIFKNITILTLRWHSRILTVLQQYYKSLLHINHIKLLE